MQYPLSYILIEIIDQLNDELFHGTVIYINEDTIQNVSEGDQVYFSGYRHIFTLNNICFVVIDPSSLLPNESVFEYERTQQPDRLTREEVKRFQSWVDTSDLAAANQEQYTKLIQITHSLITYVNQLTHDLTRANATIQCIRDSKDTSECD